MQVGVEYMVLCELAVLSALSACTSSQQAGAERGLASWCYVLLLLNNFIQRSVLAFEAASRLHDGAVVLDSAGGMGKNYTLI